MKNVLSDRLEALSQLGHPDRSNAALDALEFLSEVCERPDTLLEFLETRSATDRLACEIDKDACKSTLWTSKNAESALRLHRFLGAGPDRPHNHRWPFASHLIRGSYRHTLFATETSIDHGVDIASIKPTLQHTVVAGSSYVLRSNLLHTVDADTNTLSLVFKWPSDRDRLLVIDREQQDSYWHYGSRHPESRSNRYIRKMSEDEIVEEENRIREILIRQDP